MFIESPRLASYGFEETRISTVPVRTRVQDESETEPTSRFSKDFFGSLLYRTSRVFVGDPEHQAEDELEEKHFDPKSPAVEQAINDVAEAICENQPELVSSGEAVDHAETESHWREWNELHKELC